MSSYLSAPSARLPEWVPAPARAYVAHALEGRPLREVAKDAGIAASTVLRQVRRIETRRDDPLMDDLMEQLAEAARETKIFPDAKDPTTMSMMPRRATLIDDDTLNREAKRVLRRLCETDAFLAVGQGMPQAVVLRETGDVPTRTATVSKSVAQAFVLNRLLKKS